MFDSIRDALREGPATEGYPEDPARTAPRFRGEVRIDFARCTLTGACAAACPTRALSLERDAAARRATLRLDLGHCVFCGLCEEACVEGAVRLTGEFELAARSRGDLVTVGEYGARPAGASSPQVPAGPAGGTSRLHGKARALLGRSLQVFVVDAGSCSGCEAEAYATTGPVHDLSRFGISFVASPRHADLLLVTGPVTLAMREPLRLALEAIPAPRLVVALGACAIGGGIHAEAYGQLGGADPVVPVDVYVPGCPPRPQAILHGLLLALGRMEQKVQARTWQGAWPELGSLGSPPRGR